jgi:hypothetical protein
MEGALHAAVAATLPAVVVMHVLHAGAGTFQFIWLLPLLL